MADPTERTSMDDLTDAVAACDVVCCRTCAEETLTAAQAWLRGRDLLLGPDGLLRAEAVARMGWEPYDEAEDVPCPQWVGPYDTLVDGQSLVALSPLDPPEDTP